MQSEFFSISLHIHNVDHATSFQSMLQFSRHPEHSLSHLATMIAGYLHSARGDWKITSDVFDSSIPTFAKYSRDGAIDSWVHVGVPNERLIRHSLRKKPRPKMAVYFHSDEEVEKFCHHLKGSKENWATEISYFMVVPDDAEALETLVLRSRHLEATLVDNCLYGQIGEEHFSVQFHPVDIWRHFQQMLERMQDHT